MRNRQQNRFTHIRNVGIGRNAVLGNDQGAVSSARIKDEETTVRKILRVECQSEQPTFATAGNPGMNVEKYSRCIAARLKDANDAALLHDEQPVRTIVSIA